MRPTLLILSFLAFATIKGQAQTQSFFFSSLEEDCILYADLESECKEFKGDFTVVIDTEEFSVYFAHGGSISNFMNIKDSAEKEEYTEITCEQDDKTIIVQFTNNYIQFLTDHDGFVFREKFFVDDIEVLDY
ncbi:MAG: hypothetical protein R2794_03965 [Chitinophagales bacterium]